MPATLTKDGEKLVLAFKGMPYPQFQAALAAVSQIPGRRFNPDAKVWEFPADEVTAQKIMHTVQPQPDAEILGWLREGYERIAEQLTTALPEDATLVWERGNHPPAPEGDGLYPYQRAAVSVAAQGERVLLADEMGLGKTVEAIGTVEEWLLTGVPDRFTAGGTCPKLVVAPNSMIGTWVEEIEEWSDAPVATVEGRLPKARRRRLLDQFERTLAPQAGWLVVNWEQIRAVEREPGRRRSEWDLREPWFARPWAAVIADEAHRAKNRNAQQTRGLWALSAAYQPRLRLALTGTPIMNSPDELWALLAWIRPEGYEEWSPDKVTYWQFFHSYVESYPGPYGQIVTGAKNADQLRFELADKMIRRTKRVLGDKLPPKLPRAERKLTMSPKQADIYKRATNDLWLAVERDLEALEPEAREVLAARLEAGEAVGTILRLLPNAAAKRAVQRQVATSPALVGGPDDSPKLDALVETITDHPGKQFVAFTWHRKTAELIQTRLERRGIKAEFMHGETDPLARTEIVRAFQDGEVEVLAATIKTGGLGMTLTAASTALFAELADVPADNDQAEDRLHRIGQKDPVNSVIFKTARTMETESQEERLRMKEIIVGAVLGREATA